MWLWWVIFRVSLHVSLQNRATRVLENSCVRPDSSICLQCILAGLVGPIMCLSQTRSQSLLFSYIFLKKGLNRSVTLSLQLNKKISIIWRHFLLIIFFFINVLVIFLLQLNRFFKVHRKYFLSFMVLLQESRLSLLTLSRQHLNEA